MAVTIEIQDLPTPLLEFGTGEIPDPKAGLTRYGPFSLRFGAAHKTQVQVGLVGPRTMIEQAQAWFTRCEAPIVSNHANAAMYPDYPGFQAAFRSTLVTAPNWNIELSDEDVQRNLALEPALGIGGGAPQEAQAAFLQNANHQARCAAARVESNCVNRFPCHEPSPLR